MLYAKKSNRVQPIAESDVQHFLNLGYNITDAQGNILLEAMPEDVISLKVAFKRHVDEIATAKQVIKEYEAQIVALMAENAELKDAVEQAEKARATKTTKAKKAKDAEEASNE